ncbi:iron-sulfur cluster repair di-iron protein [Microaerobacter geothermalis]|uniref:iron-sulfur cluster repair di-iron protein n=1 Tax=Microaerobacter geothermalis TaxID=674972 RepID=UPI001F38507C|nr:iron-sulfur cluster repair di-iron protein [Microaerobacter geothermalis]MCF6094296.1 iron-sulfur cluster repair di-iron protein [Microaerobacter geothermalis]
MEMTLDRSIKIGDIVTQVPKTADIFKEYRIDFCCGGNRPLGEVIDEMNLNEGELMQQLNQILIERSTANENIKNWGEAGYGELIDYVVNKHHAYLNKELPSISQLTAKILRVHGSKHPELSQVYQLFHKLKMEMEQHMIREEVDAFPLIKQYEKNKSSLQLDKIIRMIKKLESEHDDAGNLLKELRKGTKDYQLPDDACMSYQLTYQKLEELENDLFQHVHLENNILFPRWLKERA